MLTCKNDEIHIEERTAESRAYIWHKWQKANTSQQQRVKANNKMINYKGKKICGKKRKCS